MKILQVCHKPPYPPHDGGSMAMLGLARSLMRLGHDITILTLCTPKHDLSKENRQSLARLMPVHTVYINTSTSIPALLINFIFSAKPYTAVRFISKSFRNKLISLLISGEYDVVQLEGFYLAPYIDTIRKYFSGLITMRAHNVEHEIWQRLSHTEKNLFKKYYLSVLAKRIRQFEGEYMNRYDLLVPITDRDLATFNHLGNTRPAFVCRAGIDTDSIIAVAESNNGAEQTDRLRDINSVFFLGSLDWIPNQEGLLWFIKKVLPELIRRNPLLKLHVAGRNASGKLITRLSTPHIVFHGEIKDAGSFMQSHGLMVVPCFSGSGMRVKIIEAMARGVPVITTPLGAEGIPATSGKNIIIAEGAEEFLLQTERLLNDAGLYREVSRNAYNLAVAGYNNVDIAADLAGFYNQYRK